MKALMLVLVLALAAACSAPTGTEPVAAEPNFDEGMTCRSGYAIANRNGEWVCVPEEEEASLTSGQSTPPTEPAPAP